MDGTLRGGARIGCSRNLMQYTLDHLVFKEHNGIQYSFYSDTHNDNYGFLRFAPSAVKKLTKTSNFLLVSIMLKWLITRHQSWPQSFPLHFQKFLVMAGNLTFHLNGTKLSITSGDFLMLPESKILFSNSKCPIDIFYPLQIPSMALKTVRKYRSSSWSKCFASHRIVLYRVMRIPLFECTLLKFSFSWNFNSVNSKSRLPWPQCRTTLYSHVVVRWGRH